MASILGHSFITVFTMPVTTQFLPKAGTVVEWEDMDSRNASLMKKIVDGEIHALDKSILYSGGKWDQVSAMSYQSEDESNALSDCARHITAGIQPGHTVIELGPGYVQIFQPAVEA